MKSVIKFTAEWCPSCSELTQKLRDMEIDIPIYGLDYEINTKLFGLYDIKEIPTMIMFVDNNETKRLTGSNFTKEQLTDWINT